MAETSSRGKGSHHLVAIATFAGAVTGGVVSLVVAHSLAKASEERVAAAEKALATRASDAAGVGRQQAELLQLQDQARMLPGPQDPRLLKRIEELERTLAGNAERPPEPTAAEEIGGHMALVRALRADAVDPTWAPATLELLKPDLQLGESRFGFKALNADCRTSGCELTLEWPSTTEALAKARKVMELPFHAGCERHFLLDQQPQADGKHRASLVLECTDWRANGSPRGPDVELPPEVPAASAR